MTDDLDPQLSSADQQQLAEVAALLEAGRATPQPQFRGELGRAISVEAQRRHLRPRPERLWLIVAGLGVAGVVLLLAAAAQI